MSVDNLKRVFDSALPSDRETGLAAYAKYNRIMQELARQCQTTTERAAAVFAALSPNNDYHGNLRDAHKLLTAHRDGCSLDDFSVSTYGMNKLKA